MIVFSFETITPTEAARILSEHDDAVNAHEIINRPRKQAAVRRYSADMQQGMWNAETAETLKFETTDKHLHGRHLIDGQNRLKAVEVSGRDVCFYIARGVAREAFGYIDGGEKRGLRDVLKISGEPDAMLLTPALKWMGQWDDANGRLTAVTPSTQRARKILESDPAIRKSVGKAKAVKELGLISPGIAAFLHRVFSKKDPALADAFIDALSGSGGLAEGDPFLLLHNRLVENKGSRRKHISKDVIGYCIKAWNAKRQNKPLKLLRLHRGEQIALEPDTERDEPEIIDAATRENSAHA